MPDGLLERLLAGRLPDPDGDGLLRVPTRLVAIGRGLAADAPALLGEAGLNGRLAVVSDPTTRAVLGRDIERALTSAQAVVLPERPKADQATVDGLAQETASVDALVAVGAGTVNDLCKAVAAAAGKPYAVFGTAPSMNGYGSANAAIMVAGHKTSRPAAPPLGIFLDLEVLAAAPKAMIRAGLGDSLCRPTAQADWLLAHLLLDRPYRSAPFALLEPDEAALLQSAGALLSGDLEAMAGLARTLVLSGFGMTICGASHPASQGEHLIAHYVEMMGPGLPETLHGEQIAVTTLTMARLQDILLEGPAPRVAADGASEEDVRQHFGAQLGAACWRELSAKRADPEALNHRLETGWDEIRVRLGAVLRPASRLRAALEAAGAPTHFSALGWPAALASDAIGHAHMIRNRYTALDLAAASGLLPAFARGETEGVYG
ncbi:MAG: iron-containing alcohol dehydrogenase [Pseudomonadota bacterium]